MNEYVEKNGQKTAISQKIVMDHSEKGRKQFKLHIPLDDDGTFNISDNQSNGLNINTGMRPKRVENPNPAQPPGGAGSLQVNIEPQSVLSQGVKWVLVGSEHYHESGTELKGLAAGTYTVRFSKAKGWRKPADTQVTVGAGKTTTISKNYRIAQGTGMLIVNIEPDAAVEAGAQWMLEDSGDWKNSGDTLFNQDAGDHIVLFKEIDGWVKP